MATAPQAAMDMPPEAANPYANPDTAAIYDQMRQSVSPKEFSDEMLAGASQTGPEEVAAFRAALEQVELPPEALDMLNDMVDEILANPEKYDEIRARFKEMGAPDEILPEQFDPQFFAALNMAVDQMIAEPAGVQAFAKGGIAELKPVAKAIAAYGRNGDTMLAHITPAEARMLRRRGGSGTINPKTGLPEFFLKKLFKGVSNALKAVGNAVKDFASSTVGKVVTTVALGFFLGPAAASLVGASSVAGVAAVSGFVGSAGATLLGGGNLKDALKAGAIGGLTAGAGAGVMGGSEAFQTGSYTGPTTVSGQVDKFSKMISPSAAAPAPAAAPSAIDASGNVKGLAPTDVQAPYKPLEMTGTPSKPFSDYFGSQPSTDVLRDNVTTSTAREAYGAELARTNPEALYNPNPAPASPLPGQPGSDVLVGGKPAIPPLGANPMDATEFQGSLAKPQGVAPPTDPSFLDKAKTFYNENISPSGIQQQGMPAAEQAGKAAQDALLARTPSATPAMLESAYQTAYKAAMPGILSTYGPMAAVGIGALGAAGGFKPTPAEESTLKPELIKPVTQRIAEGGNQRNYYVQGLPGVKYDQYGAPIFGQNVPLPTFDTGLGITSLMNPKGYAEGGSIAVGYADGGSITAANFDSAAYLKAYPDAAAALARGDFPDAYSHYLQTERLGEKRTATKILTTPEQKAAAQAANRKAVADAKTAKKAAGFTGAYQNINAGLSYDAPAGIAATAIAARQAAFKPTMDKFTQAQAANTATLAKPYTPTVVDQPYNNTKGYTNVLNPVAPAINYDTTPELSAAQKAAADKAAADAAAAAAAKAAADMAAYRKAQADYAAEQKAAADMAAYRKAQADHEAAQKAAADKAAAAAKAAADKALFQGQPVDVQNQQIMDYLKANPNATDQMFAQQMDYFGIKSPQVAQVVGMQNLPAGSVQSIDARYAQGAAANAGDAAAIAAQNKANAVTGQSIQDYFAKNPGMTDRQIADYMDANQIDPAQMERAFAGTAGATSASDIFARYQEATRPLPNASASFSNAARNLNAERTAAEQQRIQGVNNSFSNAAQNLNAERAAAEQQRIQDVNNSFSNAARNLVADRGVAPPVQLTSPGGFSQDRMVLDNQVTNQNAQGLNATPEQLAEMRRLSELSENSPEVNAQRDALNEEARRRGTFSTQGQQLLNMGGIASLGSGGYPRRTGQISGPGTATSDSIPAMLSDGEFVMTAKAVRGAGKGDKRAGAKRMYALMNQLEKNAARG